MKINYKNKKFKIVSIFLIIVTIVIFLRIKKNETVNYEYTNIQLFGLEDNNRTIILNDKQNMADNEIKLNISFSTTQDLLFNTVLINNFKNVDFSFNSMKSSSLQKIKFPKTKEKSVDVVLRTENKDLRLNDYILIFVETKNDIIDIIKHKRFTIKNNVEKLDEVIEPVYIKNIYEEIKHFDSKDIENLSLLDYKFSELERYFSENEYKKTYIYIDIEKELRNSPYFEKFIEDINSKKSIPVSLVIFYMKENNCQIIDGSVSFINTELNKKILIENPNLYSVHTNEGFRIMAMFYPLEESDDKLYTYKMSIWDTLFYSKVFGQN
ncbi:MAG: hypothetical protein E7G36_02785 [Peptoniphilus rhinitidis]|nr:hypothetical protein [Peptoniphilus rhinitidis]MDU3750633.1 hypothetical protein [Peptoniphilus rhinitidis]